MICMFTFTWVLGFAIQITSVAHFYAKLLAGKYRCLTLMMEEHWIAVLVLCISGVTSLFIPCGIMFYVYTKMGLILYSGRKMGQDDANSASSARIRSLRKAHSNILQTCMLLSIFYLIAYVSYCYQMIVFVAYKGGDFQTIELYITQYTVTLNSWFNPFIYALR